MLDIEFAGLHDARYAIWDWNGTLLDDVDLVIDIMNALLLEHDLPALNLAQHRDLFEFPVENYYRKLGFDRRHPPFAALSERFASEYRRRVVDCPLHDQAGEILDGVRERGMTNVILTAGNQESVLGLLEHFGLSSAFAEVIGRDDYSAGAKDSMGVSWLQARGLGCDSMILVGDTVHDFQVARSMQVPCVLVSHGHNSPDRLAECGCPVVPSLKHLSRLMPYRVGKGTRST